MDGYLDYLHVKEIERDRLAAARRIGRGGTRRRRSLLSMLLTAMHIGKRL